MAPVSSSSIVSFGHGFAWTGSNKTPSVILQILLPIRSFFQDHSHTLVFAIHWQGQKVKVVAASITNQLKSMKPIRHSAKLEQQHVTVYKGERLTFHDLN